jgi:hypothetical protein
MGLNLAMKGRYAHMRKHPIARHRHKRGPWFRLWAATGSGLDRPAFRVKDIKRMRQIDAPRPRGRSDNGHAVGHLVRSGKQAFDGSVAAALMPSSSSMMPRMASSVPACGRPWFHVGPPATRQQLNKINTRTRFRQPLPGPAGRVPNPALKQQLGCEQGGKRGNGEQVGLSVTSVISCSKTAPVGSESRPPHPDPRHRHATPRAGEHGLIRPPPVYARPEASDQAFIAV